MVEDPAKEKPSRSGWAVFWRIMQEMRGFRRPLTLIAILGAVTAPIALLQPFAMKITLDSYINEQPLPGPVAVLVPESLLGMADRMGYLLVSAGFIVLSAVVAQTLGFWKRLLRVDTKERLVLGFRTRLFGHVERLSLTYHDEKGPSESTFRIMMDTAVIPALLLDGLLPSLQALVLLVAISAVILALSPSLALVAVLFAPLMLLVSWPFGRSLRTQWHDIKELDTSILSRLQEVFAAVRVIKAFGREEGETDRLMEMAKKGVVARYRVAKTQGWFSLLTAMITALGTATFLIFGARLVRSGQMTLGELVIIAALMVQFYAPLQMIVGQVASMQSALASAERVLGLLDHAPEVIERPDAQSLDTVAGGVEFRGVAFRYEDEGFAMHGMSFAVEPGQRIGIAGHTGAGKTTLVNLLTRLYDPTEGGILLDSIDLRDIKIADLRKQFSIVLQEPVLFKKSIAENILYAAPEATMDDVIAAAKMANAHDFIEAMPEGYATVVGDRGQRLSGGERQRISLARAFLKDAPVLILDEPTSSVDMRTEAAIMDALDRLMRGRTAFIIAHRPSTLATCDRVLVMEKGRLVNFAAPDSLGSLDALMLETSESAERRKREENGVA